MAKISIIRVVSGMMAPGAPIPYVMVAASDAPQKQQDIADYVCDGTADEVQINAAITALSTSGGIVQLSLGTFNCAAAVYLNVSNIILQGMGPNTILKKVVGGTPTDHVIYQPDQAQHHITIQDLQIDGDDIGDGADAFNKGIFFNGNSADYSLATHFAVKRIIVHDVKAEAVCFDYCQNILAEDCYCYNNAWSAVTFAMVKHGEIRSCYSGHNGETDNALSSGFLLTGAEHCSAHHNYVEDQQSQYALRISEGVNIAVWPARDIEVHHNFFDENVSCGAYTVRFVGVTAAKLDRLSFHNNHIRASSGDILGFQCQHVTNVSLIDNIFDGIGSSAIQMTTATDKGRIKGNIFSGTYTYDLYLYSGATNIDFYEARVTTKSADYTPEFIDCGTTFISVKSDGLMAYNLRSASPGMSYSFVRGNAGAGNDVHVHPYGTETIQQPDGTVGDAGYKYKNENDEIGSVRLHCFEAGKWVVIEQQGTWTLAA